eukprot:gnl/MRDRNA2_/MRDRNA2_111134_c0_seq1.p1 gnl/MRDRNA2_/MRDRNA2_111134_c0~~gnl/MRDRNA2_/MRDRNA2_111134_c0_seq1.p1  ORF type:complete len:835 (-),score=249.09 gnl/MRDRNA2_/MRDRNA2_111134_c0_seq1:256-2574(-)
MSLPEGSEGYSLKFERPSNTAAAQEMSGPDFFDDQDATGGVEWFSFWDLDHDDRLGLEETAHALDRSFGLERVQYNRMRGLLQERWSEWDPQQQGLSLHSCLQPGGLFDFVLSTTFFAVLHDSDDFGEEPTSDGLQDTRQVLWTPQDGVAAGDQGVIDGEEEANDVPAPDASAAADAAAAQAKQEAQRKKQEQRKKREEDKKRKEEARKKAQEEARQRAQEARQAAAARNMELLKDKLRQRLKDAGLEGGSVDIEKLRSTLQLCKEANMEDDPACIRAQQVIIEEEKRQAEALRQKALSDLKEAMGKKSTGGFHAVEELLATAERVGVDEAELSKARAWIAEKKKRQEAARKTLQEVMDRHNDVDRQDPEALDPAVKELRTAIAQANEAWVPEADIVPAEMLRRQLHNAVQDIKGAIRVYCRVRPALDREKDSGVCVNPKDLMSLEVIGGDDDKAQEFVYDAVFAGGTSQSDVFVDCVDLVQSAVDGYNVTIFAYGQTGAGKTFTMYGSKDHPGITPRTIEEIFRKVATDAERFSYSISVSMMELYNNELVDLLSGEEGSAKPKIRMDQKGMVILENVTQSQVATAKAMNERLDFGFKRRQVAQTMMNSESSRSHLILTVTLEGRNRQTGKVVTGKIALCDLAGSERLKKSEATGEQQKEAIEINKSLTALGDVISAVTLGNKGSNVPYRNHKLTQVMQDTIGGTARTLMFLHCTPSHHHMDETIMTLKWGSRAKKLASVAGTEKVRDTSKESKRKARKTMVTGGKDQDSAD